jgi:hypothetical protein
MLLEAKDLKSALETFFEELQFFSQNSDEDSEEDWTLFEDFNAILIPLPGQPAFAHSHFLFFLNGQENISRQPSHVLD